MDRTRPGQLPESFIADGEMSGRQRITELVLLLGVALISLYFLLPNFSRLIVVPDNTDNHLSLSVTVHVADCLVSGDWGKLYQFPIYYPLPDTLTAGVNMFGQGALIAPLWALGVRSLPLLYNLLLLFAVVMAGLGARRLFTAFDAPFAPALFGAAILTLHPFKQISYLHLNMIFFFPVLWGLAALVRYLRQQKRSDLYAVSLWLVVQGFFDLSLFFFSTIVFAGVWLTGLLMLAGRKGKALLEGGAAFLFAGISIMAVFWPYLRNPLQLQYGRGGFDMMTLLPGYYLFSAWHPLTIARYSLYNMPLFIGGLAFFMLAYFYWRPGPEMKCRLVVTWVWWGLFSLVVAGSFLLPISRRISGESLLWIGDIGLLTVLLLIVAAFLGFNARFGSLERWISMVLFIMGLTFFRAPYRLIPDFLNPLNLMSHLLSQLSRLRGYRLYYYVFFVLLLLAVLGFCRWLQAAKRKKAVLILLGLIWVFECFPAKLATGPLLDPRRSALFSLVAKMRSDSGVLILPHYKGDAYENMYLPHLLDARRPFYNGYLGVGINDPLGLYEKGIFCGGDELIARQIGMPEIAAELVAGRVLILVVDRLQLWDWDQIPGGEAGEAIRRDYWRAWRELTAGFRQAQRDGILDELQVKPDGLVAVLRDSITGDAVHYRLGRRYIPEDCRTLELTVDGPPGTVVRAIFDDQAADEQVVTSPRQRLSWPYRSRAGSGPLRDIQIRTDKPCRFSDLALR